MKDLFEILNWFGSEPIFEAEVMTSLSKRFVVSVYKRTNEKAKQYINQNKEAIKEFMDAGYRSAGLGDFFGCESPKAVKNNTVLLKVAQTIEKPNTIVAMSIYNSRFDGIKCAGITRLFTDDAYLTHIAKEAIKYIIKDDICKAPEFRWIECSGSIEHYYEKFGANMIKVPNRYLPMIFPQKILENITVDSEDEYNYTRRIESVGLNVKKCIFGFPNKEILEKFLEDTNQSYDDFIEKFKTNIVLEHMFNNIPNDIKTNLRTIEYFNGLRDEYFYETTEYCLECLIKSIDLVNDFLINRGGRLSALDRENIGDILEEGMITANSLTILKPYEIGEEIITERDIYIESNSRQSYFEN